MQIRCLNKLNIFLLIFLTISIISNFYFCKIASNRNDIENNEVEYIVNYYSEFSEIGVNRLFPAISGLKNEEIQQKINRNLKEVFFEWLPDYFVHAEPYNLKTCINTERYLNIMIVYTNFSNQVNNTYICNTVDIKTGEIIYLNDLIDIDEEFVSMIKFGNIAKLEFDIVSGEYDVDYPQDSLEKIVLEGFLKKLQLCSEPFSADNWAFKPTFYLKENRLYLLNVFNHESKFYIELDEIKHKLKVDKW